MLSSFISYIPKGPKRKTKNLNVNRLPVNGGPGPARGGYNGYGGWDYNTTHARGYTSQVLDIHDEHRSSSRESRQRPSEEEFLQAPPPESPKLDLDIPSSALLTDLLPPELAKGDGFTLLLEEELADGSRVDGGRPWVADMDVAERYKRNSKLERAEAVEARREESVENIASDSTASSEDAPRQQAARSTVEDDEESVYSLEYVNFDPDAPGSPRPQKSEPTEAEEESILPYASTSRKPLPAPIKIPNPALYGPKVQLLPNSSGYQSRPQSRGNESIISTEPSSAVSGTSLARALFANTFVLSGNQTSRYRSGVSLNIARQDSATLPRGEHPLMSSPFFRDRPEQSMSPMLIPTGTGVSLPPPSSYRPSTADSMHRRMPRRSGPDPRERPKTAPSKRDSTRSLPSRTASSEAEPLPNATEAKTQSGEVNGKETPGASIGASFDRAQRRISRISEAPSSAPSTPDPATVSQGDEKSEEHVETRSPASPIANVDSIPSPSASASGAPEAESSTVVDIPDIALSQHPPQSPLKDHPQEHEVEDVKTTDIHLEDEHTLHPSALTSPNPTPHSAGEFSLSSEPGSGREIDNVLDYYQFDSQPSTFPNIRLPFSPISEESSSMLSPVSPYQGTAGASESGVSPGGDSKMSQQQNDARLSVSSTAVRARAEWSPRKPSGSPLLPIGGRDPQRRPGLLPIGERPKSFQVGPAPITLTSPLSSASPPTSSKPGSAALSASTATTLSLASPDSSASSLPPSRSIFNRARSGSAPSPIKVVRNSRDFKKYQITLATPLTGELSGKEEDVKTHFTGGVDQVEIKDEEGDVEPDSGTQTIERSLQQEFPETPSAFSPTWSVNMLSPGHRGESTHEYPVLMPLSAGFPGVGVRDSIQPASLAQQVLLTRAATSVRGARHSRQASLLRNATIPVAKMEMAPDGQRVMQSLEPMNAQPSGRPLSLKRPLSQMEEESEPTSSPNLLPGTHRIICEEPEELDVRLPELPEGVSPRSPSSSAGRPQRPRKGDPVLPSFFDPPPSVSHHSASSSKPPVTPSFSPRSVPSPKLSAPASLTSQTSSRPSSPHSIASSPRHPLSSKHSDTTSLNHPSTPQVPHYSSSNHSSPHLSPAPLQGRFQDTTSSLRSVSPIRSASPLHSSHSSPSLPPASPARSPTIPNNLSRSNPNVVVASSYEPSHSVHQLSPVVRPPPLSLNTPGPAYPQDLSIRNTPLSAHPTSHPLSSPYVTLPAELDIDHPLSPSFVAPPPYSTVVEQPRHEDNRSPFMGGTSDYSFGLAQTPSSANSNTPMEADPRTPLSAIPRRPRTRPPLPIGPRRPQQVNGHLATGSLDARQRNASAPNLANNMPANGNGGLHRREYSAQVPKFRSPVPKWRGYTLEAAKWTFSSAELQAIVSRAIRQSAEPSTFRLLQLETLDNDITREMEALKAQRADIKTRYKLLARRRGGLFDTLSAHLEGVVMEYTVPPLHILDELAEISTSLDHLAEELNSVEEQISQLTSLCEVHSASALAMALRKLNTSFLKQVADNQSLKEQIATLEAERDEAWKQAQEVANDYDRLSEKVDSAVPDSAGRRSSRVMAVRKTSIRASKAGLRSTPSFRRSHRSSASSNGQRVSIASVASGTFSPGEVPPVPPIPRRKPFEIVTDLPTRSSSGIYSNGVTPTSETRAMVRAQEELYDMLGISLNDTRPPLRRSYSVTEKADGLESSPLYPPSAADRHQRHSDASNGGRRSSLPNIPSLHQVYNAMTVDRTAMLATLGMLSDQN